MKHQLEQQLNIATTKALDSLPEIVDALIAMVKDTNTQAQPRIASARLLVELGMHGIEVNELRDRLSKLERNTHAA